MPPAILTSPAKQHTTGEQARGLHTLVAHRAAMGAVQQTTARRCHAIVVAGGKGGVGRSVVALNLAIAFAQRGDNVGLLDACHNFGNIELLCGMNGYWNLSHVVQGSRQLNDVLNAGPAGVKILSGTSCLIDPELASPVLERTFDQLLEFERGLDWLVIDASGGSSGLSRTFAAVADDMLIVTTPEATAITEAFASVKSLASSTRPRLGLLVNQSNSEIQARRILDRVQDAAHSLLQVDVHRRGYIPRDEAVPASVNSRSPFILQVPASPAAVAVQTLAQRWTRPEVPDGHTSYFFRLGKRDRDVRDK